ncbi:MAG TPA: hypothetical protein VIN40_00560 [Candidatus Tyrphobacter sp.]
MSPRVPFAGHRYVSDVLEGLLDAEEIRGAVRAYCVRLLDSLPDPLCTQLEAAATYVGGKCMGYPAIWFLERLLVDELAVEEILERCRTTLCISLTTSIVDDLADGDEPFGSAYLAYLYVLIGKAALEGSHADPSSRDRLYRALDVCLNPAANMLDDVLERRGKRIGCFFQMIAGEALDGLWPADRAHVALDAIGRFGEICAHVDDWMDAERDLARGISENSTLVLLRERLGGVAVTPKDLSLHREWLRDELIGVLTRHIMKMAAALRPLNVPAAVRGLDVLLLRLPPTLDATEFRSRALLRSV